jgi:hypothetical protein
MPSEKQERVTAELAGPLRVMKIAIQTAKIAYPDYERESGTKWPDEHLDPAEAQLFAFAALRALDGAGFLASSQRKISPMPTGSKGGEAPRLTW